MTDKKLTDNLSNNSPNLSNGLSDNEIKKALECCANGKCGDCPLFKEDCGDDIICKSALDLINRLQAENKRLSTLAKIGNTRANDYRTMRDRALKAEAEVENFRMVLDAVEDHIHPLPFETDFDKAINKAKAETYKEFLPLLENFRDEVVDKFIIMCNGNDYNKLNLMSMVDTIDCIYDKHISNISKELVGE